MRETTVRRLNAHVTGHLVASLLLLILFATGCGRDKPSLGTEQAGSDQLVEESAYEEPDENEDTLGIKLDAQHYASEFGISEEDALKRLRRSDELTTMLQEIVAVETGRVAGWGLVHEPEFGGLVYLVGEAEATAFTRNLAAQNSDLFIELGATHTLAELSAAMSERSNFEAIPDSMRDRIAYREIDVWSNSIVVAIDQDEPPLPIDDTVPVADRPIESLDLPQAAEALEALLEQTTGLPFSVALDSRPVPDEGETTDYDSSRTRSPSLNAP